MPEQLPQPGSLVPWAQAEAERLLSPLGDRWLHTQAVAERARAVSAGLAPRERDLLVAAALLHDIGYAPELAGTGYHPLDGAAHLERSGQPEVAALVAHHTGADVEAAHRGLSDLLARFPRPTGPVADALTHCDVTTGPAGRPVDPGERFEELVGRHGPGSVVARSRRQARVEMYAAVARTLRRTAAAGPRPDRLAVERVGLGCTTLLRLDGPADAATADRAEAALTSALGAGPHAVVCDLALVTDLDASGAEALARAGRGAGAGSAVVLVDAPDAVRPLLRTAVAGSAVRVVEGLEAALTPSCSCS